MNAAESRNAATPHLDQPTLGPSRPRGPRYNGATPHLDQPTLGPSRPRGPRYK